MHSPCNLEIGIEWQTLKNKLQKAANEALSKREKRRHKGGLILWNNDIKNLIENKKAYLRYVKKTSWNWQTRIQKVSGSFENINKKNWKAVLGNICIEKWIWFTWTPDKCL